MALSVLPVPRVLPFRVPAYLEIRASSKLQRLGLHVALPTGQSITSTALRHMSCNMTTWTQPISILGSMITMTLSSTLLHTSQESLSHARAGALRNHAPDTELQGHSPSLKRVHKLLQSPTFRQRKQQTAHQSMMSQLVQT